MTYAEHNIYLIVRTNFSYLPEAAVVEIYEHIILLIYHKLWYFDGIWCSLSPPLNPVWHQTHSLCHLTIEMWKILCSALVLSLSCCECLFQRQPWEKWTDKPWCKAIPWKCLLSQQPEHQTIGTGSWLPSILIFPIPSLPRMSCGHECSQIHQHCAHIIKGETSLKQRVWTGKLQRADNPWLPHGQNTNEQTTGLLCKSPQLLASFPVYTQTTPQCSDYWKNLNVHTEAPSIKCHTFLCLTFPITWLYLALFRFFSNQ